MNRKVLTPDLLTVRGLADQLGVSVQTVRRLEGRGLSPMRNQMGQRVYLPGSISKARLLLKRRRRRRPKTD